MEIFLSLGYTVEKHFSFLLEPLTDELIQMTVEKPAIAKRTARLSNSAFQDILYRARLHPKRKASELNNVERRALCDAIRLVLRERIRLKGKDQFLDLYGNQGGYTPAMGPNMKQQNCPICETPIEELSVGGGHIFLPQMPSIKSGLGTTLATRLKNGWTPKRKTPSQNKSTGIEGAAKTKANGNKKNVKNNNNIAF